MSTDSADEDDAGLRRVPNGPRLDDQRAAILDALHGSIDDSVCILPRREADDLLTERRVSLLNYIRDAGDPRLGDFLDDETDDVIGLSDVTVDDFNALHKAGLIDYAPSESDDPHDLEPLLRYDNVLVGPVV